MNSTVNLPPSSIHAGAATTGGMTPAGMAHSGMTHAERDAITPPSLRPTISWGAVLAGVAVAGAAQLGLAQLCLALGLGVYDPFGNGAGLGTASVVAVVAGIITFTAALFAGGWVAARLAHYHSHTIAGLHGILVWATGAMIALLVAGMAAGVAARSAADVAGASISAVGSGVAAAASATPKLASLVAPSWDAVKEQVKEATSRYDSATPSANGAEGTATPRVGNRLADSARLAELMGSSFAFDTENSQAKPLSETDRSELVGLLALQTGISKEAADKAYAQWQRTWQQGVQTYTEKKAQLEAEAKQAAMTAQRITTGAAAAGFAIMVLGLVTAAIGGVCGSAHYRAVRKQYVHASTPLVTAAYA